LEGTENRINVERNNFNKAVQAYNIKVRSFPNNLLAGFFNFEIMDKFEAAAGSENAPKVEF
jgi:LemA protein